MIIKDEDKINYVDIEFYDGLVSDYLIDAKYVRTTTTKNPMLFEQPLISCETTEDLTNWYDIAYYEKSKFVKSELLIEFIRSLDLSEGGSVRIYSNDDTGFYTLQILDWKDEIVY